MKRTKRIISLMLLLAMTVGAWAQHAPGRTPSTIVADALAQLPASNQKGYDQLVKELLDITPQAVPQIVSLMTAPGKGNNTAMEYALSGMARYAMQNESHEAHRAALEQALLKQVTRKDLDMEVRFFLFTQLQLVAQEGAVAQIVPLISEERLADAAVRSLVSIGGERAGEAVVQALQQAEGTQLSLLIQAAGEMGLRAAEPKIMEIVLNENDMELRQVAVKALATVGNVSSLNELYTLSRVGSFVNEGVFNPSEGFFALAQRLALEGDVKEKKRIEALCKLILKEKKNVIPPHAVVAALGVWSTLKGDKALPQLLTSLKHPDKRVRQAAIQLAASGVNASVAAPAIAKRMKSAKGEVCYEYMVYFALTRHSLGEAPLKAWLQSNDPNIKQKAIETLGRINSKEAMLAICELLQQNDDATAKSVKETLLRFDGDIAPTLLEGLQSYSPQGKAVAVELLGKRGYTKGAATVLGLLGDSSPTVADAAYRALRGVVTTEELPVLYSLMENAPNVVRQGMIQSAILAATEVLPASEREASFAERLQRATKQNKVLYLGLLGKSGASDPKLMDLYYNELKGNNRAAHATAIECLKSRTDRKAVISRTIEEAKANTALVDILTPVVVEHLNKGAFTAENRLIFLRELFDLASTTAVKKSLLTEMGKANTLQALYFVARFLNDTELQAVAAVAIKDIALATPALCGADVKSIIAQTIETITGTDAPYHKDALRKLNAEMGDAPGFESMFNGSDFTGWKGLVGNPITRLKMKPKELVAQQAKADEAMRKGWTAENGILMFNGHGDNLCTTKQYGDFEMIVDWKLDPAGPEADAGIYLRGTPQVQIWDTARVNVGAQVGSGGLYNNSRNPSKPTVVADNKLGEWNTFHITMRGDRVTVLLNGVRVVDNVIMENYWDRKQPIPLFEQIELQAHGSKVYYRDLYIKELEQPKPFSLSDEEKKEGYKVLFDGTNMTEWVGNTRDYVSEEGAIVLYPRNGGGGNLYTRKEYDDFIFRFEFQLSPDANNGLGIRTPMEGDAAYVGMELQILDNDAPMYKELEEYQYHGSVYGIIAAKRGHLKPMGEWNYQEVYIKGNKVKVTLNGTVILEGDLAEATRQGTLDGKEHPGLQNSKGHIAFLGHGHMVKFRNIRVKELK